MTVHNPDDFDRVLIDCDDEALPDESAGATPAVETYITIDDLQRRPHRGDLNLSDIPKDLKIGLADELNYEQMERLLTVLREAKELFADKDLHSHIDPSTAQHRIEVTSGRVPNEPPRRHSPHQRQVIREAIQSQLDTHIIRPSKSPYASGIVLIPKKDTDELRFCVDYRQLNKITKKDVYPLPRIDDALDALVGASFYSTFDLRSGYWQIPVAEADKEKTAFTSHEGLYEYNVMPFGLTNAPATFQRLMDVVLSGLKWRCCLVYLDDIVVFSKSFDEHLDHIRQ
ncbi:hypothetical protein SeMB42_g07980, partial [Synchytrium endobioticum]